MADMAQYDDTVTAWETIHASLKSQGWRGRIVPITYVNSSAAIKAFVGAHGGACCTSSNADKVFAWAMSQGAPRASGGSPSRPLPPLPPFAFAAPASASDPTLARGVRISTLTIGA